MIFYGYFRKSEEWASQPHRFVDGFRRRFRCFFFFLMGFYGFLGFFQWFFIWPEVSLRAPRSHKDLRWGWAIVWSSTSRWRRTLSANMISSAICNHMYYKCFCFFWKDKRITWVICNRWALPKTSTCSKPPGSRRGWRSKGSHGRRRWSKRPRPDRSRRRGVWPRGLNAGRLVQEM